MRLRIAAATLVALTVVLGTAGCTSAGIVSNRDPSFEGTIENVLVVTRFSPGLSDLEWTFRNVIREALVEQGVSVITPETSGNTLSGDPFALAAESGATMVLVVEQTESQIATTPTLVNNRIYRFDAGLSEVASRRRVWRAQVESRLTVTSGNDNGGAGRVMAQKVLDTLAEDRLLPASGTGR